ncbi:MAG: IS30 family transposase [Oscillibacter sp.]|nr:IS30 family transposase [Oscillibacter sp.]
MGKHWKHLTETDRYRIEKYRKEGMKVSEIADKLRVHRSTIYNELKRGMCIQQTYDYRFEERYCPDVAERRYRENLKAKGAVEKIGNDHKLAEYLEGLMLNDNYSPAAALEKVKADGYAVPICKGTLYNYIRKGVFYSLTMEDLPCKGVHKQEYHHVKAARAPAGESIEMRDDDINERQEPFHWEMDTVVGKRKKSKVLLVMTERMTRFELIFLLAGKKAEYVVAALDSLEKKMGTERFREMFRSITIDNGSEFADCAGMERSALVDGEKRTDCYYCHPYSSWERGSNECQNKMIRRHFPKGTDFDDVTEEQVQYVQDWMNNYPRKLLSWNTAGTLFQGMSVAV